MAFKKPARGGELLRRIVDMARGDGLVAGDRLAENRLAQRLGLSRGPVRTALMELEAAGVATLIPNRGFVLAQPLDSPAALALLEAVPDADGDYMRIANDRLEGSLPDVVSEQELMRRYDLTRPDLQRLLARIAAEGWVERMPGYGWRFAETLSSPDAYAQTTRFRLMIEPAAILEMTFFLEPAAAARIRGQQQRVLDGGLEAFSMSEIFGFGCEFHETLARASGNPFVIDSLRRVNSMRRLFAYRSLIPDEASIRRQVREHILLLDILRQGQREEAADFMRLHLRDAWTRRDEAAQPMAMASPPTALNGRPEPDAGPRRSAGR